MLRCQLYMFRTVTVHPQELLCRYCMCRLWYAVRNALSDTSSWHNVLGRTVTVRNMYSWHLSTNKHLISATTLCISLECIYIAKMIHGLSSVKFVSAVLCGRLHTVPYFIWQLPLMFRSYAVHLVGGQSSGLTEHDTRATAKWQQTVCHIK